MEVQDLTPAQCILLTVHLASECNIKALHSFTPARSDALDPELVLRILLTYLPEALDPREYTNYVEEVASRLYVNTDREDVVVSTAAVNDISHEQAQKRVRKLHLLPILPPSFPPHAPDDLLTRFLCHRAHRIDAETGLLSLVPPLVEPFLRRNDYIWTWYISVVLPLLRLEVEYYPEDETLAMPLKDFEELSGKEGVDVLLRKAEEAAPKDGEPVPARDSHLARDIRSLVGPWMVGHTNRKRRKLNSSSTSGTQAGALPAKSVTEGIRKINLDGIQEDDKTGHDWEYLFHWMAQRCVHSFSTISRAIEEWDGPSDVDLGDVEHNVIEYLDEDLRCKLDLQYAQVAFASCYAAQANTEQTVREAHGILARLAELLDFVPPPDLATSVDSLPRIERHATKLDESQTVSDLLPDALLRPEHPLTTPRMETYMLLQMMVYSAYQFSGLGYPLSLVNVAKLYFYANTEEQLDALKRILHNLSKNGVRKDDNKWTSERAKLLWLWNWGIEPEDHDPQSGAGVLGKIRRDEFEEEMLKVFIESSCYKLAGDLFSASESHISTSQAESIVLGKAMEAYDSASNGNKSRGAMKKANDIISAFRRYFAGSTAFQQADALMVATHALSFYSLTLQHGVPFQPVSIRVSKDPISLISKILEQNPRSYTKLDDLIDIARNLVSAGLLVADEVLDEDASTEETDRRKKEAERRVTFMAIESALTEDDFETAYSYIINRLTPSGTTISSPRDARPQGHSKRISQGKISPEDDISWRAAFLAGRFRPSSSSPPTLRRLEQRTELLSLALLLAPTSALTEILAAWRKCEEETTSLRLSQQQAEDDFDDQADKRLSGGIPGTFTVSSEPDLILNQKRREMGRMGAARGQDETPLSMFDLTRNAAKAISKNAFPLRNTTSAGAGAGANAARPSGDDEHSMQASTGSLGSGDGRPTSPTDGQQRVRRRDMVASAVSGGLASGLGWVLGATPANQQHGGDEK